MYNINSNSISHNEITAFVLNELKGEHRKKIINAINNNEIIREMFLFEKRHYDVERYLEEEMSIGEYFEFEELLEKKPSLKEHFELSKNINDFLKIEEFRNKLDRIHHELYGMGCSLELDEKHERIHTPDDIKKQGEIDEEPHVDKDTVPVRIMKPEIFKIGKWITAASIILMIGFSGSNLYLSKRKSIETKLFENNYELFQNNTKNYFISSPMLKVRKMYSENESIDALFILQNTPSSLDIEPEKNLYSGLVLMELERYDEAIERFKVLQKSDEIAVLSISQWYLALCYLAAEERNEAVIILEEIIENKSYNYEKAKNIMKKLN